MKSNRSLSTKKESAVIVKARENLSGICFVPLHLTLVHLAKKLNVYQSCYPEKMGCLFGSIELGPALECHRWVVCPYQQVQKVLGCWQFQGSLVEAAHQILPQNLYLPLHNIYVESSGTHLLCVGFPSQSIFVNVCKSI